MPCRRCGACAARDTGRLRKMGASYSYSAEVTITNRFGLHVRPIQRFAEFARAFEAEVKVQIEDRKAPGKSVIKLMGLKGHCRSSMKITTVGDDAPQALRVLISLVANKFFVEEDPETIADRWRHVDRLVMLASCFEGGVRVCYDGKTADAKKPGQLRKLGFEPTSQLSFEISGPDSRQARQILESLVRYQFFVERPPKE